jgi:selenocysteine lyase/cysteine desulfurase
VLNFPHPEQIAFAPNTHEFVVRLLSSLPWKKLHAGKKLQILSTDSEFYSFSRQITRLREEDTIDVKLVPVEPYDTFEARFKEAIHSNLDMIFFSHVFFNSGYVVKDLESIINEVKNEETMVVVDAYNSFMALPTNIAKIGQRAFFLGGGYKYAMAGEGACFMCIPRTSCDRPIVTGWFADFGALKQPRSVTQYCDDAFRYFGATFDPSGLYRLNAVTEILEHENITVNRKIFINM